VELPYMSSYFRQTLTDVAQDEKTAGHGVKI